MAVKGPRDARKEDLPYIGELFRECFPGPAFNLNAGCYLLNENNLQNINVFEDKSRPIAHVGVVEIDLSIQDCIVRVACVGGVCTREKYRGQRLAGRLLTRAWDKMRKNGVDFALISGTRDLYLREGCGRCQPTYDFMVQPKAFDQAIDLCVGDPRLHLQEIQRIYAAEPVHFERTMEELQNLTCGYPNHQDRSIFALLNHNAYLFGWRSHQENLGDFIEVNEYAGDRKVLAQIGQAVAARESLAVRFHVPDWDEKLRTELMKCGEQVYFNNSWEGTTKIISLGRLMEKTRPAWAPKVGAEAAKKLAFFQFMNDAEVTREDEKLKLSGQAIAELVFGTTEAREWAAEQPALKDALQRIFPLPGPRYGLNFI